MRLWTRFLNHVVTEEEAIAAEFIWQAAGWAFRIAAVLDLAWLALRIAEGLARH